MSSGHHGPAGKATMASVAFKRAVAHVKESNAKDKDSAQAANSSSTSRDGPSASFGRDDDLKSQDRISLSSEVTAVRMHQLAITLRPLPGSSTSSGGRTMRLTASRWEIRKAMMSLCCATPASMEVEATDKSASIRVSFAVAAAAEDLSSKLRGVTVKIKGVKLHAFVREVSESATLQEGEDWASVLLGPGVPESGRQSAFNRLPPGRRPDTLVLRGIPANWLGERGRAAEGVYAPALEEIMRKLGPVRCVEVAPSGLDDGDDDDDGVSVKHARGSDPVKRTRIGSAGFDVHALLENMPQPRALAKGKPAGGRGIGQDAMRRIGRSGISVSGGGDGGARRAGVGGVATSLNVDAWVQFASFRGFERAVQALSGRVLQNRNADILCEYQLGVDVTGYMTDEQRRERETSRAEAAREEERRQRSIDKARGQLVGLREGLQGLRKSLSNDGRPALEEAVKETMTKVTSHVESAEALLDVRVVNEPAATAAVAQARGEIAIGRLAIRKAVQMVNKAEEEERLKRRREKDKDLREAAQMVLLKLQADLSRALSLVKDEKDHPLLELQAKTAAGVLAKLSEACSQEGGSASLRGEKLVAEAARATEAAVLRVGMVQRFLRLKARSTALFAAVAGEVSLVPDHLRADDESRGAGDAEASASEITGAPVSEGSTAGSCPSDGAGVVGTKGRHAGLLGAELDLLDGVLAEVVDASHEDDELSMALDRAEEALETASAMLDTLTVANAARLGLGNVKATMAAGDPLLKSSEGVMRAIASAVLSVAKAGRQGTSRIPSEPPSVAAQRWRAAVIGAETDVAAAKEQLKIAHEEVQAKRRRQEQESARREAEEAQRLREQEAERKEREARALEREAEERQRAEARILAMELRRRELAAQIRNKAARQGLRDWFNARGGTNGKRAAAGGARSGNAKRYKSDTFAEPAAGSPPSEARPPSVTPRAPPASSEIGEMPTPEEASVFPDRWGLNDGSGDLAARGLQVEHTGWHSPSTMELSAPARATRRKRRRQRSAAEQDAEWLDAVSKRMRSTIVGQVAEGSWGAGLGDDSDGDPAVDEGHGVDIGASAGPPFDEKSPAGAGVFGEARRESSAGGAEGSSQHEAMRPRRHVDAGEAENAPLNASAGEGNKEAKARDESNANMEAQLRQHVLASMRKFGKRSRGGGPGHSRASGEAMPA